MATFGSPPRSRSPSAARIADFLRGRSRSNSAAGGGITSHIVGIGTLPGAFVGLQKDGSFRPLGESEKYHARDFLQQLCKRVVENQSQSEASEEADATAAPLFNVRTSSSASDSWTNTSKVESEDSGASSELETLDGAPLPETDAFKNQIRDTDNVSIESNSHESFSEPIFDIRAYSRHGEPVDLRALLDTGMTENVIREGRAIRTGYDIDPYDGDSLINADGRSFRPIGSVTFQWHFQGRHHARTYEVPFLIVSDDAPYDVILGWKFLSVQKIFMINRSAFTLISRPEAESRFLYRRSRRVQDSLTSSIGERQKREEKERKQKEKNERAKEEERERQRQKRQEDAARRNR
ncbi:hypothetical protein LTR04_007121 [Oleoguttula sp. CCFEE 6159]|nr:hypothetical protein LTR04_007121 [Oleoguttula sp. CCFEE 6159]